jgi:DNA-binding CsgD family transcriptional regulator
LPVLLAAGAVLFGCRDAISRVAHGGTVLDPEVVRQLLTASRRGDTLAALTSREREVLSLIAQGRSNAAIATTLFISPKVVEKHVANIFDKVRPGPRRQRQPPRHRRPPLPGVLAHTAQSVHRTTSIHPPVLSHSATMCTDYRGCFGLCG